MLKTTKPRRLRLIICITLTAFMFVLLLRFWIQRRPVSLDDQNMSHCARLCPYKSTLGCNRLQFDPDHWVQHFPEFVCPQNFRNLADWIISWPDQFNEKVETTTNDGRHISPCLSNGSIVYVRIWAIDEFFKNVYPHLKSSFVLITGEGDVSSPSHLNYLEESNSKIIHWFGQNGQFDVSRVKKFTHIPIGINCYEMASAIRGVHSQQSNHSSSQVFGDIDEPLRYIQPLDVSYRIKNDISLPESATGKLVLINFDKTTDGTGLRSQIWKDFCEVNESFPFVECFRKPSGVSISSLPSIYARNRQYPFWLSPRGNGIDCHRTWEALYLDIIPIVWNSSLNILYEHLPVLIIDDHRTLTEAFLQKKLQEITEKKLSASKSGTFYQYEKLRNAYWRHLIMKKSRYQAINMNSAREKQCWRATFKTLSSS
ncbi:unnamed protein product [Rotaria socialis]|uniref:Exostosin GT47 domain-containing protein n=1 Tax=Rotaria socialis TaxID=392032 RepID=A0A821TBN0_9BILA|nr:unnamed protein product [Rotaria socialis]CAF4871669.1 unnamed protein product [Rotaria socialis]